MNFIRDSVCIRLQIFAHIEQQYGVDVINKPRKWECSELKKSIDREQLRFSYMCSNRNILPIFAKVRPPVNTKKGKEEADACGPRLLKCTIDHHHKKQVLSKGLSFNVQGGLNRAEFLAAAELGISLIDGPEEVKQAARTKIVGALSSTCNHQILTTGEKKALEGLRRDHSVAIISSDEGRSTVVMDKAEYDQKVLSLLQDYQMYTIILHDPTKKLQMKVERELKELKDKRLITEDVWRKRRPGDSIIPKFYGLPKIHRYNIPLRPIVAFRGSPTYNLASNLSKRLRPLVTNSPHMLLNSEDFLSRIKGVKLEQGDVMVSFDAQYMFTSIQQDLAKRTLSKTMEEDLGFLKNQKLSSTELMGLISMCLDSIYFRFREHIYHQRKGTLMGSPISVVVAEVVMQ
ncbi:uncharacterized protein LOC143036997 [Oratosquilla oratoria]|uniref:uncharacterized protein LOC143036997 n=1 Tax=Oratosquilla oratoria TaxID=337810 RepID=UPI003F760C58